jgi:hypothetical protein
MDGLLGGGGFDLCGSLSFNFSFSLCLGRLLLGHPSLVQTADGGDEQEQRCAKIKQNRENGIQRRELLVKGVGNRVISFTDNKIVDFDIYEALSMERKFDHELYDIAHEISI